MGNLQVFLLTIFFRFLSVQATKKAESYLDSAVQRIFSFLTGNKHFTKARRPRL